MTKKRQETGARGEELAAEYLRRRGYRILRRNYRCPFGEIDIVAEDRGEVVVVEVRTKRVPAMVRPEETITRAKANRLIRLAEHYLVATGQEERPWRVDVVAVEMGPMDEPIRIEHHRDGVTDVLGLR